MAKEQFLSVKEIQENIQKLKNYMKSHKLDSFYLSSSDIFLNEYVPLSDCHRYYLTGFTGSTSEMIAPLHGRVILFVDGRYYEQADLEVDASLVEVFKCPYGTSLRAAMKQIIHERKLSSLGVEGDRIDLSLFKDFESVIKTKSFNSAELSSVIDFKSLELNKLIRVLSLEQVGESTLEKCQRILNPGEAFFVTALDSIAWLTNLRRFEMPSQSTFKAKALVTRERVYLLMENLEGEVSCPSIEIFLGKFSKLEEFLVLINEYETTWKYFQGLAPYKIEKLFYSESSLNVADFEKLKAHFGEEKLLNQALGLVPFHALKNKAELRSMDSSFNRADQAIFETINWVKDQVSVGADFSELDFYYKTNEFYQKNGALEQSFKTISAVGANSSIIHFSHPSADVSIVKEQLILLDSGGYFESGYATDTTRSFLSGGLASKRQKEVYTTVLKSLLATMNAVFPEGVWGSLIDGLARQPVFKFGLNYNHGTGHGVGINVHEGGFRLSTTSTVPLIENTVGSIEPGIYIPGFGGVRLENVVAVEKHPTLPGMLFFRSLVFVGFDHDLIDESLLNSDEIKWLEEYERECQKRGRSFKYRN
ncbi:MAG: M24 family metallopeptidase [Bacteriovorax sp.]|nr:M24 family metallopeptidase [Bacteriovorax sp.]